jgi:hypothetical protein
MVVWNAWHLKIKGIRISFFRYKIEENIFLLNVCTLYTSLQGVTVRKPEILYLSSSEPKPQMFVRVGKWARFSNLQVLRD